MLRLLTLTLFLFWCAEGVFAQKFLQLERTHSPKTRKYEPGDEITFQLNHRQWYTRVIEDVSYERNLVIFATGFAEVDSITAFRSFKNARWSRPIGNQLFNFAIAWAGFSLIDAAVEGDVTDSFNVGNAVTVGGSVALGFAIKKLFKRRTFHLKKNRAGEAKKWRLRVLDLEVKQ